MFTHAAPEPRVLDRRQGPFGETVLRVRQARQGPAVLEIISNGTFLMDTSDGTSERLLVRAALDALRPDRRPAPRLLIGGLGVGFSLREALAAAPDAAVTVVERDPAVIAWHRDGDRPLAATSAGALDHPGTALVEDDLLHHLRTATAPYDALCLDIDNGPDWTVTDGNASLYSPGGLALLHGLLAPGGVLAVWSANASAAFEERLRARFGAVRALPVPVRVARGEPDVVYLAVR